VGVLELLDAGHLRPKSEDGTDDPRNGLIFCPTHHRAFDAGLFAIEPGSLRIVYRDDGPNASRLGIEHESLQCLSRKPHSEAVQWLWDEWLPRSRMPSSA
jgi:hypothetical protein